MRPHSCIAAPVSATRISSASPSLNSRCDLFDTTFIRCPLVLEVCASLLLYLLLLSPLLFHTSILLFLLLSNSIASSQLFSELLGLSFVAETLLCRDNVLAFQPNDGSSCCYSYPGEHAKREPDGHAIRKIDCRRSTYCLGDRLHPHQEPTSDQENDQNRSDA